MDVDALCDRIDGHPLAKAVKDFLYACDDTAGDSLFRCSEEQGEARIAELKATYVTLTKMLDDATSIRASIEALAASYETAANQHASYAGEGVTDGDNQRIWQAERNARTIARELRAILAGG